MGYTISSFGGGSFVEPTWGLGFGMRHPAMWSIKNTYEGLDPNEGLLPHQDKHGKLGYIPKKQNSLCSPNRNASLRNKVAARRKKSKNARKSKRA